MSTPCSNFFGQGRHGLGYQAWQVWTVTSDHVYCTFHHAAVTSELHAAGPALELHGPPLNTFKQSTVRVMKKYARNANVIFQKITWESYIQVHVNLGNQGGW
jgi:hypothetical protein